MRCGLHIMYIYILYTYIAPAQKIDKSFITIFTEKLNFYLFGVVWLSMTSSWGEFQATLGWPNSSVHEVVDQILLVVSMFFFKQSKSNKTHPTLDDDPNWQIISIFLKPQKRPPVWWGKTSWSSLAPTGRSCTPEEFCKSRMGIRSLQWRCK